MHSARTEPAPDRLGTVRSWLQRLNVRLVIALASTAGVALLVSGIALSQILPGYFLDQAARSSRTAVLATRLLLAENAQRLAQTQPQYLSTRELRESELFQRVAQVAADELAQGTVEIHNPDGSLAASAVPDPQVTAELEGQGLLADPQVPIQSAPLTIPIPGQPELEVLISVSEPYTTRVLTLQRVTGTLIGAGLAALAVALVIGAVVARRLTGPLARLRRVSGRLAQGQLDERSPHFGVVEVDELGQQFNDMADRLSESVRLLQADRDRLREFVADVSHELRTPIAALRTFTELQRDGEVDEAQRSEFLDRSTEQINRLEWMSTNLLDLSRIDAGIFPLDMRWGDLRDPVRAVVEAHAELAEGRGISLVSEVPTSPVMLRFDRERIVQLLNNLVGNALKFTKRGGEIVVALAETPDGAHLEVRDSGPGIPEAELPLVFDRFFRGTNVGDARASGSGLGLAIARSIVEMHGGRIEAASAIGQGSVFSVQLPRSEAIPASEGS
ncbi:MAG TPA: HAMP domain-containing sensor histidine kinase [Candidatus Limnocylindria bacterium]